MKILEFIDELLLHDKKLAKSYQSTIEDECIYPSGAPEQFIYDLVKKYEKFTDNQRIEIIQQLKEKSSGV